MLKIGDVQSGYGSGRILGFGWLLVFLWAFIDSLGVAV